MSRSALEKQFLRQKQREMQAQLQAINSQHSLVYATQQCYTNQYGASYSMQYGFPHQQLYSDSSNLVAPSTYQGGIDPYGPSAAVVTYPAMPGTVPIIGSSEYYEPPEEKSNVLPIYGNCTNYNINSLLYNNIMESDYFKALFQLRTYHEVIGEIQQSVHHVEPWTTGTSRYPSTAFCLLLKFMLMRLTVKQMNGLLEAEGTPLVRAIGFLYLSYTCPPNELWKWFGPFLEDEEVFQPFSDKSVSVTMGSYCIKLLTEMNYNGTTLPRIPVPIERKIKVLLLLLDDKKKRRLQNLKLRDQGHFFVGEKVKAIYSDEVNEPAWYDAVIDSMDEENDLKYWVSFPEYGNSECVDLGDMDLIPNQSCSNVLPANQTQEAGCKQNVERRKSPSRSPASREKEENCNRSSKRRHFSRSRSRDNRRDRRSRSRSKTPPRNAKISESFSGADLLAKVLQSEREASAAVGKNYASRPATYKDSLSLKFDTYTSRKRSPSPRRSPPRNKDRYRRSRTPSPKRDQVRGVHDQANEQSIRFKSLKDKYGDASSSKRDYN